MDYSRGMRTYTVTFTDPETGHSFSIAYEGFRAAMDSIETITFGTGLQYAID